MANDPGAQREWLEADGLGGFASGTAALVRTRRYHAVLLAAATTPTGRQVLVNGFDAWLDTPQGRFELSAQCYAPGVIAGDGGRHLQSFEHAPWPTWVFCAPDGTRVQHEVFAVSGRPLTCLRWKLLTPGLGVRLSVRPFLSSRDYHALHQCNPAFRFAAEVSGERVSWEPYADVAGVAALGNGRYRHEPLWYYNFRYEAERLRGLDCDEDLAAPGVFEWLLDAEESAVLLLTTQAHADSAPPEASAVAWADQLRDEERERRQQLGDRLDTAAEAYLVQRRSVVAPQGKTVIAGYPWFADWGRDTFIAMRGLCLARDRTDTARDILLAWAATVSQGMLPNRFPDQGDTPEFNSVDASLWFVVAVREVLQTGTVSVADTRVLRQAVEAILTGYSQGTRYRIRADDDGLLACGEAGVQLTWMDAKVGDWVVTPRIGKPVEVQALWLNALDFASGWQPRWRERFAAGLAAFGAKFWNAERGCLFDVVDADHVPGRNDPALRPNQIFAVGGLPLPLLRGLRARQVIEVVEQQLWTPAGLRSLAPGEPGYAPRYEGNSHSRDGSYHQGTIWPWLAGPFVEAWLRTQGDDAAARQMASDRYLAPLLARLDVAGLGHLSEIADGDAPHTPRGCPFQAWSMGELLRLDRRVLAAPK